MLKKGADGLNIPWCLRGSYRRWELRRSQLSRWECYLAAWRGRDARVQVDRRVRDSAGCCHPIPGSIRTLSGVIWVTEWILEKAFQKLNQGAEELCLKWLNQPGKSIEEPNDWIANEMDSFMNYSKNVRSHSKPKDWILKGRDLIKEQRTHSESIKIG